MRSRSLEHWKSVRCPELDEMEKVHASVGGTGRGRRYATQQVNYAYVTLLSGHFQGFCRDLHSEMADHMADVLQPVILRRVVSSEFRRDRRLDRGNPTPGNIGADFSRLGMELWPDAKRHDIKTQSRQGRLEAMNQWRNAIAHQDFATITASGARPIQLAEVRAWRSACHGLAMTFDRVSGSYLQQLLGKSPW